MVERKTPEALIAEYEAAYLAVNGERLPYVVTYDRGWFHLRAIGRWGQPHRRRRKDIEHMISNLNFLTREGVQP